MDEDTAGDGDFVEDVPFSNEEESIHPDSDNGSLPDHLGFDDNGILPEEGGSSPNGDSSLPEGWSDSDDDSLAGSPEGEAPDAPERGLTATQREVLDGIRANLRLRGTASFITGVAGTGKTRVLQALVAGLDSDVHTPLVITNSFEQAITIGYCLPDGIGAFPLATAAASLRKGYTSSDHAALGGIFGLGTSVTSAVTRYNPSTSPKRLVLCLDEFGQIGESAARFLLDSLCTFYGHETVAVSRINLVFFGSLRQMGPIGERPFVATRVMDSVFFQRIRLFKLTEILRTEDPKLVGPYPPNYLHFVAASFPLTFLPFHFTRWECATFLGRMDSTHPIHNNTTLWPSAGREWPSLAPPTSWTPSPSFRP